MATSIQICNLALRSVGSSTITALTDDSEQARILSDIYTLIRDEVMEAHPWNFAIKRAELTAYDDTPEFDYDYMYVLPTDCLRVLRMEDKSVEFKIEGGYLLTDETPAEILYIAKITDASMYNPRFYAALAARLASELAFPLANSKTLGEAKYKEYLLKLKKAKSVDGQEGTLDQPDDDSWLDDRT